jgi:serine protease Do
VEVAREAATTAGDFQAKIDKLKADGRPAALLMVANPEGEIRFVALSLR